MNPPKEFSNRQLLNLQPTAALYQVSAAFCLVGLATQLPADIVRGGLFNSLNDAFSLLVFGGALALFATKRLNSGMGLLVNLLETLRNIFAAMVYSGFVRPNDPASADWMQEFLLLTCLFATVIGLTVNKVVALWFAGVSVILLLVYMQIFEQKDILHEQFMLTSLTMSGSLFVVYIYRVTLERLVGELREALVKSRVFKDHAQAQEVRNRPFVTFGRNTAGLVHDFRNDINSMALALQTLQLTQGKARVLDARDMDQIERSVQNLRRRIEMVQYLTEANQASPVEPRDLRLVLESALYPFRISDEIRNRVDFRCNFIGSLSVEGMRLAYLQLFENIVRNSCEAIIDSPDDRPGLIEILLARYGRFLEMEFTDNAGGIPVCFDCTRFNCIDCPQFAVGKTSKPYGSGFGMINIFKVVKQFDGRIKIKSKPRGTMIIVSLPQPELPKGTPEAVAE